MNFQIHTFNRVAASLLLCGLAAHASAAGTVVLDSYGPDIDMLEGWPTPLFQGQDIAIAFDIGSATDIQSILTSIDGVGGVTLGIVARTGALPDGSGWLYSTHLVDPWANTLLSPAGWTLAAGSYWLVAVADAGFSGQWQSGTDTPNGSWAYSSGGNWTTVDSPFTGMPAARITVSAVPEPASYGLMLAGGLLVAAAARRKSNATRG
ncbi:PEP-CTERM sorting domain-containing protein [Roseateles sp.]|uniref:PEP-CTERM sorting domain-containing protein n=1 Tax=Roseateles sp. TaxID=1971397 RepID=UPI0039E8DB31